MIGGWAYAPDVPLEELKEQYAPAPSSFIEIEGAQVHYRIEGRGTPLVLLHGTAASLHTWDGWTQALKNDFAIIRLDLPGFGLTGPHPERRYSVADYAAFLNAFLQKIGVDQFSLAGNSLGGAIAWHYTAVYPEKVDKLILLDPSGIPKDSPTALIFSLAKNRITGPLIKKLTPRAIIKSNLHEVYLDDEKVTPELVERYRNLTRRAGNRQAFIDKARTTESLDTALLRQINSPALIQWGAHDEWIPVADVEVFDRLIPTSEVIIYENSGHVPMEEIPEKSAADARHFLLKNHDPKPDIP